MRKILLVDDEPIMCEGLRLTVPWEECGAEVVGVAQDGLEALNWLEAHGDVDIILSDVRMPIMDGLEMAERLHKLPKRLQSYSLVDTMILSMPEKQWG